MSEKKVPVEETIGSAQNEVDKTYTLSNSFHQFGFQTSNSFQEEQNAALDDHLLRHAHR